MKIIFESRKYDIVHLHDRDILIPALKTIYPRKPVIIHYHGSKIRSSWKKRRKYWKYADRILISTTDLYEGAPEGVVHIPNPVDTTLFFPVNDVSPDGEAVYFKYDADDIARELAKELGMKLTINDKYKNPISYENMPNFLRRFKVLIDVKRDFKGNILCQNEVMSKTALEAIACGLKVVNSSGTITEKLPEDHLPQNVSEKIYGIYMEVVN